MAVRLYEAHYSILQHLSLLLAFTFLKNEDTRESFF